MPYVQSIYQCTMVRYISVGVIAFCMSNNLPLFNNNQYEAHQRTSELDSSRYLFVKAHNAHMSDSEA